MTTFRDVQNSLLPAVCCFASVSKASFAGSAVDRQGSTGRRGAQNVLVVFTHGSVADGVHTPYPEHSDDNSTWSAASPYMSNAMVGASSAVAASVQYAAYLGDKRYFRCGISVSGATNGGSLACVAILGAGRTVPLT